MGHTVHITHPFCRQVRSIPQGLYVTGYYVRVQMSEPEQATLDDQGEQNEKERMRAEMQQYGSYRMYEADENGYLGTFTDPLVDTLREMGVENIVPDDGSKLMPDSEAAIIFNDPIEKRGEGMMVSGTIVTGDEVEDARTYSNQRRIMVNNRALQLYLPKDMLAELGAGDPPVLDVWAGDGAIMLKTVETEEEINVNNVDIQLGKLPKVIMEDVKGVYVEGRTPAEQGVERGLETDTTVGEADDPQANARLKVEDNIERAKEILGGEDQLEAAVDALEADAENETVLFQHIGQQQIRTAEKKGTNWFPLTKPVTHAMENPKDAVGAVADGEGAAINFDLNGGGLNEVPAWIETGEDVNVGGELTRSIDTAKADAEAQRYQVRMPETVLEELGIDPDNADDEYIVTLAASGEMPMVVFRAPQTEIRMIEQPEPQSRSEDTDSDESDDTDE